jgi:chromosome segregation ATPase
MFDMEWILDSVLVVLLTATLFHAVRLERALGVLKRDRASLEELVASFNASTRSAESGIERLHSATEGNGRQIQRLIDTATTLKEDLTFLVQRGEGLADRLDETVRAARPAQSVGVVQARSPYAAQMEAAQVEPAELRRRAARPEPAPREAEPKVRSQAERDLLKALRMVR